MKNIDELTSLAKEGGTPKVAVVCAHDEDVLISLKEATQQDIVKPVLFGDEDKIRQIMQQNDLNYEAEIISCQTDKEAAESAVKHISSGKAQMLMKGLISSGEFLKAALNKEWGLNKGKLLSHVALISLDNSSYLLTDAAINIAPELMDKKDIAENAVEVAHKVGLEKPKIAPLCAVELLNPKMQATMDAAMLSKMNERGQIRGCIIDGPLALDNAVSIESAQHKKIKSEVAGQADILLAPNIEAGNVIYKTFGFFSEAKIAGLVVGATAPIVMTSRADSYETKFNSIVFASSVT